MEEIPLLGNRCNWPGTISVRFVEEGYSSRIFVSCRRIWNLGEWLWNAIAMLFVKRFDRIFCAHLHSKEKILFYKSRNRYDAGLFVPCTDSGSSSESGSALVVLCSWFRFIILCYL